MYLAWELKENEHKVLMAVPQRIAPPQAISGHI